MQLCVIYIYIFFVCVCVFADVNLWIFCFVRPLLIHLVVKQLLGEHKVTIIQKGLDDMLKEKRKDDLKLLYNLMGRVKGGLQLLCSSFNAYIKVTYCTVKICIR